MVLNPQRRHGRIAADPEQELVTARQAPFSLDRAFSEAMVIPPRTFDWNTLAEAFEVGLPLPYYCEIYFVRHGESVNNAEGLVSGEVDTPLTANGRSQVKQMARRLPEKFDMVFCSTLKRAMETMAICLRPSTRWFSRLRFDSRLNERSLGVLENGPQRNIPEFAEGNIDYAPDDGESYRKMSQRCFSFFLDMHASVLRAQDESPGAKVVFVFTHMGPMRVFEAAFGEVSNALEMMATDFVNVEVRKHSWSHVVLPEFLL